MPSHTAYELVFAAFGANLPFGAYRSTVQRLSWRWFLAIHVPIPAVFLLRTGAGYSYWFIPWLFAGAVCGQFLGGRLLSAWRAHRGSGETGLPDCDLEATVVEYGGAALRDSAGGLSRSEETPLGGFR
jgi:hypothetical protein